MESPFLTPQEYLEIETRAAFKSAYWNGSMYPMDQEGPRGVDSPQRHSAIVSSLTAALAERLPNSQWRVEAGDDHDVAVFFKSELIVAIEVLSPSTERADRGEKFHRCRRSNRFRNMY